MYRESRSVPRGYEYLASDYYVVKKRNGNILRDLPPAPYLRKEKDYLITSPIRSKKMLVAARKFKTPLSEREKNFTVTQTKFATLLGNITNLAGKNKVCNTNLMKKCQENIKRMKSKKSY